LVEMATAAVPYLQQDIPVDEEAAKKHLTPTIARSLEKLADRLTGLAEFSHEMLEQAFKQVLEEDRLKMGQLSQPVRVALTGQAASPGIFEVIDLLGRERTLARLKRGIERARGARP